MSSQTVVLITGANRGLGLGLTERFLALPEHTVITAVRDPSSQTATAFTALPCAKGSSVILASYSATSEQSSHDLVAELSSKHGLGRIDIVVSNAGIAKDFPAVKDLKADSLREHFEVNVLGSVWLYQATRALLQKSAKPVFAFMGSGAGGLGRQPPIPNAAYAPTKTMINWFGVRINAEDEWLNSYIIDPGWVQTEMGNAGAVAFGFGEQAPQTVAESCDGMLKILTTGTKEKYGGKWVLYTGEVVEW